VPTWTDLHHPLRLVEQKVAASDPDPKALACYGVLLRSHTLSPLPESLEGSEAVWLRFVERRPLSAITIQFLDWCCSRLEQQRVPVWVVISR
jgi:hypothetical protein